MHAIIITMQAFDHQSGVEFDVQLSSQKGSSENLNEKSEKNMTSSNHKQIHRSQDIGVPNQVKMGNQQDLLHYKELHSSLRLQYHFSIQIVTSSTE